MFEQAVLRTAPARPWAVPAALACQLAVVGGGLTVSLFWPQLLPRAEMLTWISIPPIPPPALKPIVLPHARVIKIWNPSGIHLPGPEQTPRSVVALDGPPAELPDVDGSVQSYGSSARASFLDSILRPAAPAQAVKREPAAVPSQAAMSTQQIRVSGPVQAARLIYRVDPVYPPLAVKMRITGTVQLAGIIGIDGRIRELHVTNGHPLLVRSALEAVRQWVYQPTVLNREPVEVVTTITVVFRLH